MCSVNGCNSWLRLAPQYVLPEDLTKRLEWIKFLYSVNGQKLMETSWFEIKICGEHFTPECFLVTTVEAGPAQLRSDAVPTVYVKTEPGGPEIKEEVVEAGAPADEYEQPKPSITLSSVTEDHSNLTSYPDECKEPKPCQILSSVTEDHPYLRSRPATPTEIERTDYGPILEKIENLGIIKEKVALLQQKNMFVVNEKRLFELFCNKCPNCQSGVKMEKVAQGAFVTLNLWCLQCDYSKQWKNQNNSCILGAGEAHEIERTEIVLQAPPEGEQNKGVDSDDMEDESSGADKKDSDDDWDPEEEELNEELFYDKDDEDYEDYDEHKDVEKRELCTDCGKFFDSRRMPHTCDYIAKPYSCNHCGKRFASEMSLYWHDKVHNGSYMHYCKYCHTTFKTKADKLTHEQSHTEELPFKCPDCPEGFASYKDRLVHQGTHPMRADKKCHVCGLKFGNYNQLQRHIMVHTGVKPFKCSVCERGFNQHSHLKSHMRLHTGEKPYKCKLCEKSFNHNVSLKNHVQRYHASNSGTEQDSGDAQGNGNERNTQNTKEDKVAGKRSAISVYRAKCSLGRPKGRPKRSRTESMVQAETPAEKGSDAEELPKRKSRNEGKGRGTSDVETDEDPDSDFEPTQVKKKRQSSKSWKGSGKRRGRPKKVLS